MAMNERDQDRELHEGNRTAVSQSGAYSALWALAFAVFAGVVLALIIFTPGGQNVAEKGSAPPSPSSSPPSVTTPPTGTTGQQTPR